MPGWLQAGQRRRSQFLTRYTGQQETASTPSPKSELCCQPGKYPSPGLIPQTLFRVAPLTSWAVPSEESWH